jgi:hypothetical protein
VIARPVRRRPSAFAAPLVALCLATAGLVALSAPAQAAALTSGTFVVQRSAGESGPANCTTTNSSSGDSKPFTSNGSPVSILASGTATVTDDGDPGDVSQVPASVSGSIKAKEAKGELTSVAMQAKINTSITSAQGLATDCDPNASHAVQAIWQMTLGKARWVRLSAQVPGLAIMTAVVQRTAPATPTVVEQIVFVGTSNTRQVTEFRLPPGTYQGVLVIQNQVSSPQTAADPSTFKLSASAEMTFVDPGTPTAKAAGTGAKFVKSPKARSCASDQLKLKFGKAAGKAPGAVVKSAEFRINGKKAKTVKAPKAGGKVTLKKLVATEDAHLEVIVRLRRGGKAVLTRTYLPCL